MTMESTLYRQVVAVKDQHSGALMRLPGVVGVGISRTTTTGLCIKLYLRWADSDILANVPERLDGVPVVTEVIGEVAAN